MQSLMVVICLLQVLHEGAIYKRRPQEWGGGTKKNRTWGYAQCGQNVADVLWMAPNIYIIFG